MEPETCVRGQTHTIWGHYCMKNLLLLELLSKYIKGVYRENYRVGNVLQYPIPMFTFAFAFPLKMYTLVKGGKVSPPLHF